MSKIFLIVVIVLLFGCGTERHLRKASEVITPFGKDTYALTYTGNTLGAVKSIVYKAANQHCESLGKVFMPKSESVTTETRGGKTVALVFRCLDRNDPEFKRPDWEHRPDTVIEDSRKK